MGFKSLLALSVSKLGSFAGSLIKRGTDAPGIVALKIDSDILKHLKIEGKVIAVTGSNGKTTTSNLIAHLLRKQGYSVINNVAGSNMTSGIVTTLCDAADMSGRVKADYIVLEVDECYARFIFKDMKLDYFLILNLLRDQVVRNGHPDLVYDKIGEAIAYQKDAVLILNANEPISQRFASYGNKCVYFAMAKNERSVKECISGTNDAKLCPCCFKQLKFNYFHYNHLGDFYCESCGYKSHEADYLGTDIDFENKKLKINGEEVITTFDMTYNLFNAIAASATVAQACGKEIKEFKEGFLDFTVDKSRLDRFSYKGREVTLLMTKQNAASLDQSIAYTLEQEGEKTVVIYINNVLYLDYKDISWLYDVAFDRLKGEVNNILCSGNRAYDAGVCLQSFGFEEPTLVIENDSDKLKEAFDKTSGDIYVLAASAFGNEDKILEVLSNG